MQFFLTAILVAASAVSATPLSLNYAQKLDTRTVVTTKPISDAVVTPRFTAPAGGESYKVGSNQTATWDTTEIKEDEKDYTGVLYLGYSDGESSSENLDIAHPLAYGFKLINGEVNYTIPANTTARDSYFLALVGDSGNISPPFSITA